MPEINIPLVASGIRDGITLGSGEVVMGTEATFDAGPLRDNSLLITGGEGTAEVYQISRAAYDNDGGSIGDVHLDRLPDMPGAKERHSSATTQDYIYAVGGSLDDTAYRFNRTTETWQTDMPDVPTSRANGVLISAFTGSLGWMVFYLGGNVPGDETSTIGTVHRYREDTNSWTAVSNHPSPVTYPDGIEFFDKLYVHGGQDSGGGESNNLYEYDVSTDNWTQLTSSPSTWTKHIVRKVNPHFLYALTGESGGVKTANVELYDIYKQEWSNSPPNLTSSYPRVNGVSADIFPSTDTFETIMWGGSNTSLPRYYHIVNRLSDGIKADEQDGEANLLAAGTETEHLSDVTSSPGIQVGFYETDSDILFSGDTDEILEVDTDSGTFTTATGITGDDIVGSEDHIYNPTNDATLQDYVPALGGSFNIPDDGDGHFPGSGLSGSDDLGNIVWQYGSRHYVSKGANDYNKWGYWDDDTETWTDITSPPTTVTYTKAATVGDFTYMVGGLTTGQVSFDPADYTNALQRYDNVNDTWTTLQPHPVSGWRYGTVRGPNDDIWTIALQDGNLNTIDRIYKYDISADSWSQELTDSRLVQDSSPVLGSNGNIWNMSTNAGSTLQEIDVTASPITISEQTTGMNLDTTRNAAASLWNEQ